MSIPEGRPAVYQMHNGTCIDCIVVEAWDYRPVANIWIHMPWDPAARIYRLVPMGNTGGTWRYV